MLSCQGSVKSFDAAGLLWFVYDYSPVVVESQGESRRSCWKAMYFGIAVDSRSFGKTNGKGPSLGPRPVPLRDINFASFILICTGASQAFQK